MTLSMLAADFDGAVEIDDCWKQIGVQGNQSCPELERHSHCRNCPAFSRAAARLLDRDLGEAAVSLNAALGVRALAERVETQSVMIFRLGAEWFALPTLMLDEIVGTPPIHSLPHRRSPALLGLANVRGELVICASVAQLLVGEAAGGSSQGRLIVARHGGGQFAFPVDEVLHTYHYRIDELQPLPATVAHSPSSFTKGLLVSGGKTIGLLDGQSLFEALDRSVAQ